MLIWPPARARRPAPRSGQNVCAPPPSGSLELTARPETKHAHARNQTQPAAGLFARFRLAAAEPVGRLCWPVTRLGAASRAGVGRRGSACESLRWTCNRHFALRADAGGRTWRRRCIQRAQTRSRAIRLRADATLMAA